MAQKNNIVKPYLQDRDEQIFIGIDYPFHKSTGAEGWFKATPTTLLAIKNNIRMLLKTEKGERFLQPKLGVSLRRFIFEQFTEDTVLAIQDEIMSAVTQWLPFVIVKDIKVTMDDGDRYGSHTLSIFVEFSIQQDPNSLESVELHWNV